MTENVTDSTAPRARAVVGVRSTKQRSAISALLDEISEFRSAQELHDELRKRGEGIGLTTVYRTLQTLADAGTVDVLRTDTGESVYRRCSSGHHHHLVCRACGYTVEVDGPAVEQWSQTIADSNGFTDVSHTVEIFGNCRDCSKAQ
ncbi:Fur family transcriptional regulator [Prescottella soli]|uniref:Fur family transcriptional regulator n=1 Tax=Prescottella soli TaxID=1543852 RepID=A0ABW9FUQ9_9NOCA